MRAAAYRATLHDLHASSREEYERDVFIQPRESAESYVNSSQPGKIGLIHRLRRDALFRLS